MNEQIAAAKSGRGKGNAYSRMKKEWTDTCAMFARMARVPKLQSVKLSLLWVEQDRRRDPDNIRAATKFILDGLVDAGVLVNDGHKQVKGFDDEFAVDKARPGVQVLIREQE